MAKTTEQRLDDYRLALRRANARLRYHGLATVTLGKPRRRKPRDEDCPGQEMLFE